MRPATDHRERVLRPTSRHGSARPGWDAAGSSKVREHANGLLLAVVVGIVVVALINNASGGSTSKVAPVAPTAPPITLDVTSCDISTPGYATAKVTVMSNQAYSYVGLSGDFVDGAGTVIGQGIGNLSGVQVGQTYQTEVIYSLSGGGTGGHCSVDVDSVLP